MLTETWSLTLWGEVVDIHGQGMSVNDLGGISGITESMTGEDTLPDYMADNTYEI